MDSIIPALKPPHNLIYYLGVLYIFLSFCRFFRFLKPFLRPTPLNLLARYGPESYVLITGSSDGLGKAFAFAFAGLGFNLILVSRSQQKLQTVKEEIQAKHPKIQIKIIARDFLHSTEPGFFDKLHQELEGLDISILINNVALDYCQEFLKTPEADISNLMTVNLQPLVSLTYRVLPGLIARATKKPNPKKSLIINISSISGVLPTPYFSIYSSTKAFMEAFTKTLAEEYRGKCEFMVVRPNFMSTNMNFNAREDFETISPMDCVNGVLRDIGRAEVSNGHWRHHLLNEVYAGLNEKLVSWYYMRFMGKQTVERCEDGRKKKK